MGCYPRWGRGGRVLWAADRETAWRRGKWSVTREDWVKSISFNLSTGLWEQSAKLSFQCLHFSRNINENLNCDFCKEQNQFQKERTNQIMPIHCCMVLPGKGSLLVLAVQISSGPLFGEVLLMYMKVKQHDIWHWLWNALVKTSE